MARNLMISEISDRWLIARDDVVKLLKAKGITLRTYAYDLGDGYALDVEESAVAMCERIHWREIARYRRREQQRQLALSQLLLDLDD